MQKHAESENTQAQEGNLCQFRKKKEKKKEEKALEENFPIRIELEMNNTQINYLEFALGWDKNSAWVLAWRPGTAC